MAIARPSEIDQDFDVRNLVPLVEQDGKRGNLQLRQDIADEIRAQVPAMREPDLDQANMEHVDHGA